MGVKQAYTIFLHAYPASFHRAFAEEMAEVFADKVDEAAGLGMGALLWLAAREIWFTAAAIFREYWLNRNRYLARFISRLAQFINSVFPSEPADQPNGRNSWAQTVREVVLFAILGMGQVVSTYLPVGDRILLPKLLTWMVLSIPMVWLLLGVARGMPRWAYPSLGILVGYCFTAALATHAGPLLALLILISLGLLGWAFLVDRRQPFLPDQFHAWKHSLTRDFSRLSFGAYGFLVLAIMAAFDDGYADNHTGWMLVAVLCMLAGAGVYSRSRTTVMRTISLGLGATLALLAALCDHAHFTGFSWPVPGWISGLWLTTLILILLPAWILRILRVFRARFRPDSFSQRG